MNNLRQFTWNFKKTKYLFSRISKIRQSLKLKNESFHDSIGWVLIFAQFFCLMPVIGVFGDIRNVRFKVYSIRLISCIVLIVLALIEGLLAMKRIFEQEVSFSELQRVIFLAECIITETLLIILARNWGKFVRFWKVREDCFLREPYVIKGMKLKTKICTIAYIIFILSIVEHSLFWVSTSLYSYRQYIVCKIRHISFVEFLFVKERPYFFMVIPFQYYLIAPILFTSFCCTICWNFIDILIIITSIALARRFEQINERITIFYKQAMPQMFWVEIRNTYVNLIQILEKVDQEMALLIIMSCACNLFSICYQLFNSVNEIPHLLTTVYFWFSLFYLISRTVCVLYFAASVNDASRKPLRVLREIPTKFWNSDIQRLTDLVQGECIALSGKKFFFLTRKLILAMAGTVVTYELVLMQEVEQEPDKKAICNITRFNFTLDRN